MNEQIGFCLGLLAGNALFQPRYDLKPRMTGIAKLLSPGRIRRWTEFRLQLVEHRKRSPEAGFNRSGVRTCKPLRCDADDRVRQAVQLDGLPDHVRVALKLPFPEPVAEDEH